MIELDPAELPKLLEGLIGDIFGNLGGFPGGEPPFRPPEMGPPPFPGGEKPFMPPEIGPLPPHTDVVFRMGRLVYCSKNLKCAKCLLHSNRLWYFSNNVNIMPLHISGDGTRKMFKGIIRG